MEIAFFRRRLHSDRGADLRRLELAFSQSLCERSWGTISCMIDIAPIRRRGVTCPRNQTVASLIFLKRISSASNWGRAAHAVGWIKSGELKPPS